MFKITAFYVIITQPTIQLKKLCFSVGSGQKLWLVRSIHQTFNSSTSFFETTCWKILDFRAFVCPTIFQRKSISCPKILQRMAFTWK